MRPFIEHNQAECRELTEQALALLQNADARDLNTAPAPDSWCAAECVQHIVITGKLYIEQLSADVSEATRNGPHGDAEYAPGFIGKWILDRVSPPPKMRMKTFPIMEPTTKDFDIAALTQEYLSMKDGLLAIIESLEGIDIRKKRAPSVVSKMLRLPIGLWILFLAAHERRHLWQAQQALERVRAHKRQAD